MPPILPEVGRSWTPGRNIARAGSPLFDPADDLALWKLRSGTLVPDLDAALDRALASLPADATLCLRPDCRSVLSDVPTILGALRRFENRLELLLAPADLIAPAMLPHASDHFLRILSAFESHPAVRGVILEDIVAPIVPDSHPEPVAAGTGLIPEAAWRLAIQFVHRTGWPLVIDRHDASAWLHRLA